MTDFTDRSTVVGVFPDRPMAERAVQTLRDAGFLDDQIGILMRDVDQTPLAEPDESSYVGEGAATGAMIGGLIGAGAALLIPGIGMVIAGGILAAAFGTAAVGAATGGILGALVGLGVSEDDAHYYEGQVTSGRTLVTVRAGERFEETRAILEREGAENVRRESLSASTPAETVTTPSDTSPPKVSPPPPNPTTVGSSFGSTPGVANSGVTSGLRPWPEVMTTYQSDWRNRYGLAGGQWADAEPAYRFGYEAYHDPRYASRDWTAVEADLERNWEMRYQNGTWERMREYVRSFWYGARRAA